MLASGKTQREVAEHFGFRDKYVVKSLVKRERAKQRKREAGITIRPGDDNGKMLSPKISLQNRLTKFGVCAWRMNCCGIFCDPQEGSESKGKVCSDLPPQERVSHCCNVQILFSIEKRLLQLCKADEPARKGCCSCETIRQQQAKCFHTYGYRRMWQWLKGSKGIYHNPKTILRVMKKYGLLAEIRRRRKWQQMGQHVHKYQNLLNEISKPRLPTANGQLTFLIFRRSRGYCTCP